MSTFTIKDVTVKERILLHLSRFSNILPGQIYNVPFDLTQDGIAMATGITRSHASLDLKKLGETGMVTNWQAHQRGVRSKRLVYSITPAGIEKADRTREKLKNEGIDIDVILDMRKCDPETKWNTLSPEDKEVFGKICVLRVPVLRDEFPPTTTGVLPTDVYGMTSISEEVSKKYLANVSQEDIRKWNSWAADWWLEKGNKQERLHHLVVAGRDLEAAKMAVRYMDEFMANPNEDLLENLEVINPDEATYEKLLWLKSQVAASCRSLELMKKHSKELAKLKSPLHLVVDAQMELVKENYDSAFGLASEAYDALHTPLSAILMARACVKKGDLKSADELAITACDAMHKIGDAKDIDEILKVRAEIAYRSGDKDAAYALLGKAMAAAPEFKKNDLQDLLDAIKEPDTKVVFD